MAKYFASQVAERTAGQAIEWCGGVGFTREVRRVFFLSSPPLGAETTRAEKSFSHKALLHETFNWADWPLSLTDLAFLHVSSRTTDWNREVLEGLDDRKDLRGNEQYSTLYYRQVNPEAIGWEVSLVGGQRRSRQVNGRSDEGRGSRRASLLATLRLMPQMSITSVERPSIFTSSLKVNPGLAWTKRIGRRTRAKKTRPAFRRAQLSFGLPSPPSLPSSPPPPSSPPSTLSLADLRVIF